MTLTVALRGLAPLDLFAGAAAWEPVTDRQAGVVTASVLDPFGNVLGPIQGPHHLEILVGG